jgi:hypothetical protein
VTVALWRDVRSDADGLDLAAERIAIVALVAMKHAGGGKLRQQRRARRAVGDVAARQQEGDRPPLSVRERVDLGRSPAAGAADRLIALPPLPPAAER